MNIKDRWENGPLDLSLAKDLVKEEELKYKQTKKNKVELLEDELWILEEKYYLGNKDEKIAKQINNIKDKINTCISEH